MVIPSAGLTPPRISHPVDRLAARHVLQDDDPGSEDARIEGFGEHNGHRTFIVHFPDAQATVALDLGDAGQVLTGIRARALSGSGYGEFALEPTTSQGRLNGTRGTEHDVPYIAASWVSGRFLTPRPSRYVYISTAQFGSGTLEVYFTDTDTDTDTDADTDADTDSAP